MRIFYGKVAQALGALSRKWICDEHPDERRARLREEALEEIDAQVLPIVHRRLATQLALWDCGSEEDETSAALPPGKRGHESSACSTAQTDSAVALTPRRAART